MAKEKKIVKVEEEKSSEKYGRDTESACQYISGTS